ncbi:MAG: hypothetical protein ACLBM6_04930, partial [Cuspidothrix sp.]
IKLEWCPYGDIGRKEIAWASVEVETENNDPFKLANPIVKIKSYPVASDEKNKLKALAEKASTKKEVEEMALRAWNREIDGATGFQGHTYSVTGGDNLDLSHAVYKLPSFKVLSIEGNEDFLSKIPPMPEGRVS